MPDPLDSLLASVRAAIERDVHPHAAAIARVRSALEAYESAIRKHVEAAVASRAASALGIAIDGDHASDDEQKNHEEARRDLESAVQALLALTDVQRPAPAVEPRVEAPRDIATPEQIAAFVTSRSATQSTTDARTSLRAEQLRQRQTLEALLDRLGEPRALDTDVALIDELEALTAISEPDERARWDRLSRDDMRLWLTHLVARARFLRERSALNASIKSRLRDVIVRFPEYAAVARPGHVNGLRLDHEPAHGTWDRDVRATYAELRALVDDEEEPPESDRTPSRKSRASRTEAQPVEPLMWKYRDRVSEQRIVMFGGSVREDARENLEQTLGIATLEWVEGDKPRRVEALAESIARGSYDVVIVLARLVHHKDAEKVIAAAKRAEVPFAVIDSGYGVEAVRAGLEGAFDARERAAVG